MGMVLAVVVFIFLTGLTISIVHAGPLEPQVVLKAFKAGGKTCKQIERDYEKMKGQHEMMFTAWKEKSLPVLTEDNELLAHCNDAIRTLKEILEKNENTYDSGPSSEILKADYEKAMNLIGTTITRHKTLRDEHERFFHEMMGH